MYATGLSTGRRGYRVRWPTLSRPVALKTLIWFLFIQEKTGLRYLMTIYHNQLKFRVTHFVYLPSGRKIRSASHCHRGFRQAFSQHGLKHHRNNLTVDDNGIIWWKSPLLQLLVPKPGREQLFLSYHASLFGGHLGRNRTLAWLAHHFYWSGMADDVKEWLGQCVVCVKRKSPVGRHHPLGNIPTGHRWDRIAMDILDVCDPTPDGYRYILVIADYFCKWTEAFLIKNKCADTVADILVEKITLRFGMPLVIHSDQGREFENGLTIQSQMTWLNNLIESASWCCPCSSMTGGIIGMSCYHMSCTHTARVSTSRPVTLHFVSWWGNSAVYHRMFPLLNLELTGNMTYHHIRSQLGFGTPWRSLMITFENHYIGQWPAGNGYMTLKQWIGNSLLDRGCYNIIPDDRSHGRHPEGPRKTYCVRTRGRFKTMPRPKRRLMESRRFCS